MSAAGRSSSYTTADVAEAAEVSELAFLLNAGNAKSKRTERSQQQLPEGGQNQLAPPTRHELQLMAVQAAVDALNKHAADAQVVQNCCERWQSLGYGPGRRQSAYEAGALAAIVAGMRAHPDVVGVQEKASLAIANICSGTDGQGLARKAAAADAGAISAIADAMRAFPKDAPVLSNASAALGNICFAADESGLDRKQAAFDAGALPLIVLAMHAFPQDVAVAENGAFALGNLCRAPGKVGNSSTGDFAAPELQPIEQQLKRKAEGQARKQAAADAGALAALVNAMKSHSEVEGVTQWGARALSIITFESGPLREAAKKAGAKMQWLMGLTENMDAAQKAREIPMSKTGRAPAGAGKASMGSYNTGRHMASVRGY